LFVVAESAFSATWIDRKPGGAMAGRWQLALVAALLGGCTMPSLQLPGFPGPSVPSGERIGSDLIRISVAAKGTAECASADECTLAKAAEVARGAGGTHFLVLPGHGGPTQRGYAYIKVLRLDAGEGAPSGAVSVEEALFFYGGRREQPPTGSEPGPPAATQRELAAAGST
jgi:hypothetical protein